MSAETGIELDAPWSEQSDAIAAKVPIGSGLTSAQWHEKVLKPIRDRAFFSARVQSARTAQFIQDRLGDMLSQKFDDSGGTWRERIVRDIRAMDEDVGSPDQIRFMLDTNKAMAAGFAQHVAGQDEDTLFAFPAQELTRAFPVFVPRGEEIVHGEQQTQNAWPERFAAACQECGDDDAAAELEKSGRMVARKDSGVWQALGDGAGGYTDTLGNPYPPFAFNSGMDVEDIARDEAVELGLVKDDGEDTPEPSAEGFNDNLKADVSGLDRGLVAALVESVKDYAEYDVASGVLKWILKG